MSSRYRLSWPKSKLGRVIFGWFLVVVFGWMAILMSLIALDWTDDQWVTCQVLDAEATKGNRFSSTVWRITIETTDCGNIIYRQALSDENVEFLADSFEPGAYEFKLGFTSQLAADGWVPTLAPSTSNYRPLD